MDTSKYLVKAGSDVKLNKISTDDIGDLKSKEDAKSILKKNIKQMQKFQAKLYAHDDYSLLIIFQAMDAAGKDSTIKHVMSGLNPQGTDVHSFKHPSAEELNHDYLWRINKALPERGRIGIFNRSYYEEVLVVRVHELIKNQKIPPHLISDKIWEQRYSEINNFEKYLYDNGTVIIKFFLHVSKYEQKKRFISRIDTKSKNWKFSESDIKEREFWSDYQKCYQEAIAATSKKHAPWYVIPADHKWYMRLLVSQIIVEHFKRMKIDFPKLNNEQLQNLSRYKKLLQEEKE